MSRAQSAKEEWAMLIEASAKQYQSQKQQQRRENYLSKIRYKYFWLIRQQLDEQLQNKDDKKNWQKNMDKKYYQFILEEKQKQEREQQRKKAAKMQEHKKIYEQNQNIIDTLQRQNYIKSSSEREIARGQGKIAQIGFIQSQDHAKKMTQKMKLNKYYHLQHQVYSLNQQKIQKQRQLRQQQIQIIKKQKQLIDKQQQDRIRVQLINQNMNRIRFGYHQNMNIYDHYQKILDQNHIKEKELNQVLVENPRKIKMNQQALREQKERHQKLQKTVQMRDSIIDQIEKHNQMKKNKQQFNQQFLIGSEYKLPRNNKSKQYIDYLKKQMQQQKNRKHRTDFMSEQQYRMNIKQLNQIQQQGKIISSYSPMFIGSKHDKNQIRQKLIS